MITTKLTEKELLEMGFIKKPLLLHPSRTNKSGEFYLGQIDENGNNRELLVYTLPKGFRFEKHIVVNYRNEIYLYVSGFMAGGIEVYKHLEHTNFYFNETTEWENNVKEIIFKLKPEERAYKDV